jgi:hypothetical protein
MQLSNPVVLSLVLVAVTASVSSVAQAGPSVHVTFKNQGAAEAVYTVSGRNEVGTNANASPRPDIKVGAGRTDSYKVQSNLSLDANYAVVRYQMGSKVCQFSTTFVNAFIRSGVKVPKWNKSAVASGGAVCTATITATNFSTYAWSVEFTMK